MKLFQNVYLYEIERKDKTGLSTRSLGQIFKNSCVHSRGHSFEPIFMKQLEYKSTWNLGHVRNWVIVGKI